MDIIKYRNKDSERERTSDLLSLIPNDCSGSAIDIGALDGWHSIMLAEKFDRVVALDIEKPWIEHSKIECHKGDAANLMFKNEEFDLVFCTEVLEHITYNKLKKACSELERVAKKYVLIGVPFKQDIRLGRTTCYECGKVNPPWGHVNRFDENSLKALFPSCAIKMRSFVGEGIEVTNFISVALMDFAGNPYGPNQGMPCIHCGIEIKKPPARNSLKKIATRFSFYIQKAQKYFCSPQPNWIHILFEKR